MLTAGILVIDIGTSSIRASVITPDGVVLDTASTPTPTLRTDDGGARLDAEACWRGVVGVAGAAASGYEILAVGASAQLGLVIVDASGWPVSPLVLWSDRSAEPQLERVRSSRGANGLPQAGRRITSELAAARVLQFAADDPTVIDRGAAVLSLKDFLVARLTGELVTDPTHASYTLLFDIARGEWSDETCDALGVERRLLPAVRPAAAAAGFVTPAAAEELGIRAGIPVACGGPDGTVGSLGAGATAVGAAVDIAGSTDVLVQLVDVPVFDSREIVTTNAHVLDGRWTVGGATGLTGGGIDWLAQTLDAADAADAYGRWGEEIVALQPGAMGALGYTTLTGQRFPFWDLSDRGGLRGLAPLHRPPHLVAAFQEGAAFLVRAGLRETARFAPAPERVQVVGGIARRPEVLQLRADAWGLPVEGIGDGMATSRGAAVLAGLAAGLFGSVDEAVGAVCVAGVVYDPDASAAAAYADIFATWELLRVHS